MLWRFTDSHNSVSRKLGSPRRVKMEPSSENQDGRPATRPTMKSGDSLVVKLMLPKHRSLDTPALTNRASTQIIKEEVPQNYLQGGVAEETKPDGDSANKGGEIQAHQDLADKDLGSAEQDQDPIREFMESLETGEMQVDSNGGDSISMPVVNDVVPGVESTGMLKSRY